MTGKTGTVDYDLHHGNIAYVDDTHPGFNITIATTKTPEILNVKGRG
jgi:hypothetical protein